MFSQIRKALVPLGVAVVLWVLNLVGVTSTPELEAQVVLVITSVLVYFIPNSGSGE